MKINLKKTERGFPLRGAFVDGIDQICTIEESQAPCDKGEAIWLGRVEGMQMHIDRKLARMLGAMLTRFADTGELE